jgi:predicted DNA binding CopG/RHH family protein
MSTIDKDEKELLKSFEDDEWVPVRDKDREIARYKSLAAGAARKNCRVNIRLSKRDLLRIKERALREGIPYQTLIASVLHKYGTGALRDVPVD